MGIWFTRFNMPQNPNNKDCWPPALESQIQHAWGGAQEFAFLSDSQSAALGIKHGEPHDLNISATTCHAGGDNSPTLEGLIRHKGLRVYVSHVMWKTITTVSTFDQ